MLRLRFRRRKAVRGVDGLIPVDSSRREAETQRIDVAHLIQFDGAQHPLVRYDIVALFETPDHLRLRHHHLVAQCREFAMETRPAAIGDGG
ncbi:MAG: hypothetical protein EHM42_12680, partial [Planctomycetaceae bacterium]